MHARKDLHVFVTLYLKTQTRVAKAASCSVGLSRVSVVVLAEA